MLRSAQACSFRDRRCLICCAKEAARPGTLEEHDGGRVVEQALALHHDLQLLRRARCARAPSKVGQASTALVTPFRA
jgi:hypothetical protein